MKSVSSFRYIYLPVSICSFALKHKLSKPLKLYLILKFKTDGIVVLDKELVVELCSELKISKKTFDKYLHKLQELNWIGRKVWGNLLFIRSLTSITHITGNKNLTSAELYYKDIEFIQSFMVAAIKGKLANHQKWKKNENERRGVEVQYKGRAYQSASQPSHFPIAICILANLLNLSNTTICRLKNEAVKRGFLSVKKNFSPTGMSIIDRQMLTKFDPDFARKLRFINGAIYKQEPDLIAPKIRFKKRR